MITFLTLILIGSAFVTLILNFYWAYTGQNGYTNHRIGPINGILLTVLFGSLLSLALTAIISGV